MQEIVLLWVSGLGLVGGVQGSVAVGAKSSLGPTNNGMGMGTSGFT